MLAEGRDSFSELNPHLIRGGGSDFRPKRGVPVAREKALIGIVAIEHRGSEIGIVANLLCDGCEPQLIIISGFVISMLHG